MDIIVWSPGVTLDDIEKQVIKKALSHFRNNKTATANALGISIRTIDNRIEKYAQEEKIEEEKNAEERRKREDFLMRSRGIATSKYGHESSYNAEIYGHKSSEAASKGDALPLQKPEHVRDMLPSQVTNLNPKKHR